MVNGLVGGDEERLRRTTESEVDTENVALVGWGAGRDSRSVLDGLAGLRVDVTSTAVLSRLVFLSSPWLRRTYAFQTAFL